jgi:peptidoglycan hydrolase-like protein with peptidoglycan-binding domain
MKNRIALFTVTICLALTASVCADENVRAVQTKLRDTGFYLGEIDGAYSSQLSAALSRYQIRNGLPITGQLDADTAKALGVKPAVATPKANNQARTSETWQRLRKSDKEFRAKMERRPTPAPSRSVSRNEPAAASTAAASTPTTATPQMVPVESASPPSAAATSPVASELSTERLRDYVGAFVLAGLDPRVGAEAAFFADPVQYYNQGTMDREKTPAGFKALRRAVAGTSVLASRRHQRRAAER